MMFAFVCSLGVGLAMMASPAQVCDDNTTADQTIDLVRHDASVRKLPTYVKHEWKTKRIDVSNIKVYKRGVVDKDPQPETPKINATKFPVHIVGPIKPIIHDPHEFPPPHHGNGYFPTPVLMVMSCPQPHGVVCFFNSNDQQRLVSGHSSLYSPSYCPTTIGNGFNPNNNDQLMVSGHSNTSPQSGRPNLDEASNHTLINIITGGRNKGTKIINDPIIDDPWHENMPDPIDPKRVDR